MSIFITDSPVAALCMVLMHKVRKWYKNLKQDLLIEAWMKHGCWHSYIGTNINLPSHTHNQR